ncbi:MAG: PD40 domain-containing protein [Flavobacteriales bacterium]|nr:PD40 domain-containing protein [Flavobacteriales bacterium]MCB9447636.1 PD40 domain-containing protein [Flavobacteriales bacterium]
MALLKDDGANLEYNYRLGICYLQTYIDKTLAISFLKTAMDNPKHEEDTPYYLGVAYMHAHQFEDAIKYLEMYKKTVVGKPNETRIVETTIQNCHVAKIAIQNPIRVKFENLGSDINTANPEYNPYISPDEETLIYTSRSKKNMGDLLDFDDEYPSDVFIATAKSNGEWRRGRSIGSMINTELNEETAGMSADGQYLFICIDNFNGYGDIWYASKRGRGYQRAETLDKDNVNGSAYESSATVTNDEQVLVFSSNRDGGQGGMDLYMCKMLPTGQWGKPINLGPKINTPMDEEYPAFSPDQQTLYFASNGPKSMGGYDIFKTEWQSEGTDFQDPQNLGFPLNTTADETTISFDQTGRYAYMARGHKEGSGDLDIYRLTIEDVDPRYSVIKGFVLNADSTSSGKEGIINIYDADSKLLFGVYKIKPEDGKYLIILPPGKWHAEFDLESLDKFTEDFEVKGKGDFKDLIERNFIIGGAPEPAPTPNGPLSPPPKKRR